MAELLKAAVSAKARMLLCHGAGAPVQSEFCQQLASHLAAQGIDVWGFNFAYMQQCLAGQRRPPPKMPVLIAQLQEELFGMATDLPLILAGKSMGARVVTMLCAGIAGEVPAAVKAVCCYGYPFHPPKKDSWRTGHFDTLRRPVLVMQGERDPFGTAAELCSLSWPEVEVNWLRSADHDFKPLKSSGLTQQQLLQQAAERTGRFIDDVILET
ncbi:alpha/beta family hydrolase [Rheinheimera marina]|uniref:Alpha/beta family hydrolase n=1 Tax=Rheinheimera marina TaxID=1774958 RepID=A0ABV9JKX1_9GAMM